MIFDQPLTTQYQKKLKNLHITIIYAPLFRKYKAVFKKDGEIYEPKTSRLQAPTWDSLLKKIEKELFTSRFQHFIGDIKTRDFYKVIYESKQKFYLCP